MVCLRTLPVSHITRHQMIEEGVTNELEEVWKKWTLARYPDKLLGGDKLKF